MSPFDYRHVVSIALLSGEFIDNELFCSRFAMFGKLVVAMPFLSELFESDYLDSS